MVAASARNNAILEALRKIRELADGASPDANLAAVKATTAIQADDRSGMLVHARFETASMTAKIRPVYFVDLPGDPSDGLMIAPGDEITLAATSLQDEDSYYVSAPSLIPNFGFAKVRMWVTDAPGSGACDIYVAEVQ